MRRWACAVWRGAITEESVGIAWEAARRRIVGGKLHMRWVRGPVAAMVHLVLRLDVLPWQGIEGVLYLLGKPNSDGERRRAVLCGPVRLLERMFKPQTSAWAGR